MHRRRWNRSESARMSAVKQPKRPVFRLGRSCLKEPTIAAIRGNTSQRCGERLRRIRR